MNLEKTLNALLVYILMGVIISAFFVQFIWKETPCPLCLLQRLGMIGVAFGALLNVYFGVSRSHYGLAILSALTGGAIALRQIELHACPGSPPFGSPVFGLSLYTWSFIVFICSLAYIALCLCLKEKDLFTSKLNSFEKGSLWITFFVVIVNFVATTLQCGLLGPCE